MVDPYRFNFIIVIYVTIVYKLVYNINLKTELIRETEVL